MMHRRQKRQAIIGGFLAVVAVVNILFFFILLRPTRANYVNMQGRIDAMRQQATAAQRNVAKLEKTSDQLERFEQDREGLFSGHFIKFDPGFAELSPRLEQLAIKSGVQKPVVDYTRDEVKQYGLYQVKVKIPVKGTYANAVNFIKTLETADTFFLIESIDVRSASDDSPSTPVPTPTPTVAGRLIPASTPAPPPANTPGMVSLSLSLETFFYK
jgi:Tfp pilus assembly protein PilO